MLVYEKEQGSGDCTLNDHQVAIQVSTCSFKRKKATHLIRRQFMEHQDDKPNGVGGVGVGVITQVGKTVTDIKIGTCVVFIIPENSKHSGVGHCCIVPRYFCFACPSNINKTDVAVTVDALITAYYAIHNKATRGDTVLICDGHTPAGQMAIQLLHKKGCKIVAYLAKEFEKDVISPYRHMIDHFFEGWIHRSNAKQICNNLIRESDNLGYSLVLCLQSANPLYADGIKPGKEQVGSLSPSTAVMVMSAGGNLVLANSDQPPHAEMFPHLFAKGCSLHLLNPTACLCSPLKLGSLLNFLISQLESLELKEISPPQPIHRVVMEDAVSVLNDKLDPMNGSYVVEF